MNSIWNNNINLFKERFPALANLLEEKINNFEKRYIAGFEKKFDAGFEKSFAAASDRKKFAAATDEEKFITIKNNHYEKKFDVADEKSFDAITDEKSFAPAEKINNFEKSFAATSKINNFEISPVAEKINNFKKSFAPAQKINNFCERRGATKNKSSVPQQHAPFPFWELVETKSGGLTARDISCGNALLHSAYNPEREAEGAVAASDFDGCKAAVFFSFGLGYTPIGYARRFPSRALVVVEPDAERFFAALALLDWSPVFQCASCALAIACSESDALKLIEQMGGAKHCAFFKVPAQTAHAQAYFNNLQSLVERNKRKDEINAATLERFSNLWIRNTCKNLAEYARRDGVKIYENNAKGLPFVVVAAGPSLEKILPHMREIKKRSVIVCVDTALRALLRMKVEPDFIIIGDPQYWAYRHIAGLSSPASVLVADISVCPAVFRFPCRKIVLAASPFPPGKFFEKRFGGMGDLGAGGSVAASAWTLAYFCGSREIYCAGLDLAFPKKNTHIKGSLFEQQSHETSTRTHTAECDNAAALFAAGAELGKDYDGNDVPTDSRMKLFAWWFESAIAARPDAATYTLCPEGLAVPGIKKIDVDALLAKPEIINLKNDFFAKSEAAGNALANEAKSTADAKSAARSDAKKIAQFKNALAECKSGMAELRALSERGKFVCKNALALGRADKKTFAALDDIDARILKSGIKDVAALVFPTEQQLDALVKKSATTDDPLRASLSRSLLIYTELEKAVATYEKYLP